MAGAFRQKGHTGGSSRIEVEGAKELRRSLKHLEGNLGNLRDVHRDAGEVVRQEAASIVPVLTGALRSTLRVSARNVQAAVLAGGRSLVPYAGPIHFGWHARNIEPQPFLYEAADRRRDEVRDRYERQVAKLIHRFDREAPD